MITELKMVIQLLEEQQGNSDYYSIRIDSSINRLKYLLTSLESQEARLREWEVKEKSCEWCGGELKDKHDCYDAKEFTTRPATFDDVMDAMNNPKVLYDGYDYFKLPDGRELRRKT